MEPITRQQFQQQPLPQEHSSPLVTELDNYSSHPSYCGLITKALVECNGTELNLRGVDPEKFAALPESLCTAIVQTFALRLTSLILPEGLKTLPTWLKGLEQLTQINLPLFNAKKLDLAAELKQNVWPHLTTVYVSGMVQEVTIQPGIEVRHSGPCPCRPDGQKIRVLI